MACGIFPDQGLNPCPLHWQADSEALCHQGSPQLPGLKEVQNVPHQKEPLLEMAGHAQALFLGICGSDT